MSHGSRPYYVFGYYVLPPRALNVGNLPGCAAITELPLVDGLQLLETLPVAVNDGGRDFIHALVTASHIFCKLRL